MFAQSAMGSIFQHRRMLAKMRRDVGNPASAQTQRAKALMAAKKYAKTHGAKAAHERFLKQTNTPTNTPIKSSTGAPGLRSRNADGTYA